MKRPWTPTRQLELPQITGRRAHALIWFCFATNAMLALLSLDDVRSDAIAIVTITLHGAVWLALTLDTGPRLKVSTGVVVIAICVLATVIASPNSITGGFSQWYVGAAALAMFYVSLRGRTALAWFGFAAVAVAVVWWGLSTEDRLVEAIVLVARQVPYVLVGSLFSFGMRRTGQRLEGAHAAETARAAAEAANLARSAERARRLATLDAAVGSQLKRIADGAELTDDERQELLVAEAQLRDSLRARQLDLPQIVASVRRARRRGVTVLMLDDRYPLPVPPGDLSKVIDASVRMLDSATSGTVTIRLLPAGRPVLTTLVADGDEYSRVEIPAAEHHPA